MLQNEHQTTVQDKNTYNIIIHNESSIFFLYILPSYFPHEQTVLYALDGPQNRLQLFKVFNGVFQIPRLLLLTLQTRS